MTLAGVWRGMSTDDYLAWREALGVDYRELFRRHRRGEKAERIGYVALCLLAEVAR